ncbi:MAG: potassium channel family protein [Kiritimatiellia bacterium]
MKTSLKFLRVFFKSMGYLAPIWVFLICVIFGLGFVIARLENLQPGDGMYFAWVTAFTVGYGDVVPGSALSRICALAIALTGMIFTGIWVAVAVNAVKLSLGGPLHGDDAADPDSTSTE